jgi:uncharacterized iron-regulated membrane protein
MADTRAAKLRRLWLNVHLWIGVSLAALLIPISISGALLVWHDEIDAVFNPHRYAVSGTRAALPPTVYLSKAAEAVANDPAGLRASVLRYPEQGSPVRVVMRAQSREQGTRPQIVTVFMDPPTAAILDVMEFRSSFFGFLHVFHENLTIPEYSGRQIVGWAGIGFGGHVEAVSFVASAGRARGVSLSICTICLDFGCQSRWQLFLLRASISRSRKRRET